MGVKKERRNEFLQRDYFLYSIHRKRVLKFLRKELEKIKKSRKKTLWFYSGKATYEKLKNRKAHNLSPHDVNNIIHVLLKNIKE